MARSRGMKRFLDSRNSAFKIQITSMVDMFIILLVFLLKSYSTSPVNITPNGTLHLPQSSTSTDPVDVLKLAVSKTGIFVEDDKVLDLKDGQLDQASLDKNDAEFIRPLYDQLDKKAQHVKDLAKVNDTVEFDGKVLMQVDKDLPLRCASENHVHLDVSWLLRRQICRHDLSNNIV